MRMGSRIKDSPETTFEVYVEVVHSGLVGAGPEVRRVFPDGYADQETLQTVPKFCFPFSVDSLAVGQVGQNFTFVLTDIDSKQRFGFCRLSSGAQSCYCILSYLPWFEVFYKLLNVLADYTIKGQASDLTHLPVVVPIRHAYFSVPDLRQLPSIPENRNLTEYFVAVDVNNMLHLYASMLYERRVLISSSKLSTKVRGMALDDVVILNVDTNTLETPFDDLQSLPNDVVSSLKNRLKKVSTTTGDGVARAFLKAQAALFGSYRSALCIEPFIDGRLELLNSGEGFSDVFEEEINMGEYAGSDKVYYQWLLTVKAKDHAKMGIKEVKSRLKQKELTENGYPSSRDESGSAHVASTHSKDMLTWEQRQPITVHFGQQSERGPPPRPTAPQRPPPPILSKLHRSTQPFSGDERIWTLPALKHSSYNKLRKGPDTESPRWDRPLSVPPLEPPETQPPSQESSAPSAEGSITIPRPQGRKTPEPGAVLSPAVTLLQGLRQGEKESIMLGNAVP
ncbi:hypothetical protein P4O66_004078 [Electrophorus voltai]|uniref:UDENN domain-containing protein n=1 Tax=Electrophorus voltai TaxID=2609070 RepID=A0AAD8ZRJ9_9TELE|nr:hypothetical protein P4O66_004078 [Electrophorus voltai]